MPWDPIALSAWAARMVVAAASTDPSEASKAAKQAVPQLLGRGDPKRQLLAELQLDQTRDQLQATAGQEREQARAALEAVWRAQLTDLLAEHWERTRELRDLVDELQQELRNGMVKAGEKARTRKQWRDALQPLPGIFDWYKVNAFAGILLAAGFVVLKCYTIARGDLTTALGILQYAGLATVVIAGLLSSLPILTAAMLAYAVIQMIGSPSARDRRAQSAVVLLGAFVLAAVYTPWTYLLFAAVIGLVIGLIQPRVTRKWMRVVYVLVALCALPAVVVNLSAVWLPHEIVTFRPGTLPHGRTQEVGYVLSEDNGWITMLITGQGQEHTIIRVPDAMVKTQTVCERQPMPGNPASYVIDAYTLWRVVTGTNSILSTSANVGCSYQGL
jgi:hypothetical protein